MTLARAALHPPLKLEWVKMPPACPHHPVRCCLASEPSPGQYEKQSGLDPCPISTGYPTGTAPCPTPVPSPAQGIPAARLAHSSWILPWSHDSWLLSRTRSALAPGAPGDSGHGRPHFSARPCTRSWITTELCWCLQPGTALSLVYTQQKGRTR